MDGLLDINELEEFIHEVMELEGDDHEGHEHAEAEKVIQNPGACPVDTNIQVFHMEAGEHVLEFESEHDEDFNMAVLKMLGGHAHHHHDHDDHSDEEGDHDDHDDEDDHGDEMCHNTDTHENYESTEEDCEDAGHVWMGHEDHDLPEIHADRVAHTLSFPEDDHDDHSDEEDDHDDHSDEEDDHDDHSDEEHHEAGAVVIHIEVEGDYGFALPNDVELYVLMAEGGHDDHDDHDDHSDEEDDHDDHGGEIGADDDEAFDYDPHSWLDPLAFKEQVNLVLEKLTMTFPDGTEVFAANAEGYSSQLTLLNDRFEQAFGEQGTCVTDGHDKTIVANHNAYSYMSVRYDIEIMTVHGLDPEGEPSPAQVAEVVEHIKEEGITVLFVEEFTDQSAVQSIVDETGVEIQILYTMEMSPSDSEDDYMSMMNKNLVNIVSGIGC